MKIAWVFDFDNTLVFTDEEVNKSHLYMKIAINGIDEDMLRFLVILKNRNEKLFILTGRHPDLKEQIANYFDIKKDAVICRSNDTSIRKTEQASKSKDDEEKFLKRVTDFKINRLNKWTVKFDLVLYFDDMFERFLGRKDISQNVVILPPSGFMKTKLEKKKKIYMVTCCSSSFGYTGEWKTFDTLDKAVKFKKKSEDLSEIPERYHKEFKQDLWEIHTIEVE